MADPEIKPTPTQEENDRAAAGEHVIDKEHDGSEYEQAPPEQPPEPEPDVKPVITSIDPTSGPPPSVAPLVVNGQNFTSSAKVWFGGEQKATTVRSATRVDASVHGGVPGDFEVFVRDVAGDSNVVTFTFTTVAADEQSPSDARGRRRR